MAGTTAASLFKFWQNVANEYGLDISKHVGLACEGAASMLDRHNSLSQKVKELAHYTEKIHCHAHRFALACTGTIKAPLRSAKLVKLQKMLNTDGRKLAKACKTRWLSHDAAVTAAMSEITAVWAALPARRLMQPQ